MFSYFGYLSSFGYYPFWFGYPNSIFVQVFFYFGSNFLSNFLGQIQVRIRVLGKMPKPKTNNTSPLLLQVN